MPILRIPPRKEMLKPGARGKVYVVGENRSYKGWISGGDRAHYVNRRLASERDTSDQRADENPRLTAK